MALPIAHAAAGYLVHRLDRRRTAFAGWSRALAFMVIANLPDADFLVGFVLGKPGAFHRGLSHTLLAALVFGAALGALSRWRLRDRWLSASVVFACVYGSHLLLDALTVDERGPAGAQFFWPFSGAYYIAPLTVFTEIIIDGSSRLGFLASVLAWPTVVVLAREAALVLLAIGAFNLIESAAGTTADDAIPVGLAADAGEEDPA
jgi:membrane-bound metal-dependent hydrolase YbcI (DUF457 family)